MNPTPKISIILFRAVNISVIFHVQPSFFSSFYKIALLAQLLRPNKQTIINRQ